MKPQILSLLIVAAIAPGIAGCSKESDKPIAEQATDSANTAADSVKKFAADAKDAGQKLAQEGAQQVEKVADAATTKTQQTIDRAKKLFDQSNYQEALTTLQGMRNLELTPEQQKMVADLKARIQKVTVNASATQLSQ
jgi:hypothetical protein